MSAMIRYTHYGPDRHLGPSPRCLPGLYVAGLTSNTNPNQAAAIALVAPEICEDTKFARGLAAAQYQAQRSASAKIFSLYSGENTRRVRFSNSGAGDTSGMVSLDSGLGMSGRPQSGALISILSDTFSVWTEVDT